MQSRKRPVSLVYVELPPANGGMMRDLSEFGFSLRAMMPLQSSEKVAFSFILEAGARIDGDAIVVRLEDGGRVAALEFAGLSAHARDQIRAWLDKYDESVVKEGAPPAASPAANSTFEELRTEIRTTEGRPKAPRVQLPVARPMDPAPSPMRQDAASEPPPLLKLSSVRPKAVSLPLADPIPPEVEAEAIEPALDLLPAAKPEPELESGPEVETPQPLAAAGAIAIPATHLSPELLPDLPAALEPLSSLEGESEKGNPGWMEKFTLGRAIAVMLLLTAIAGSFVFHREVGHALVWLGQKIAGDETAESKQLGTPPVTPPSTPAPAPAEATENSSAEPAESAPASVSAGADSSSTKSAELPEAAQTTPAPQLKDSNSEAMVPLAQITRPSSEAPADGGQQEYQRAQAILRAPNRAAELPEAVRLLWAAVEKGNVGAEITLAELYRAGRGVAKNCAQAKILMSTAARKGSPDAQRRLEALQHEGCEE